METVKNDETHVKETPSPAVVITPEALLDHWQGHRRVTRRVIEAFPEDKLFGHSIGGMRPFSELAIEMIDMCASGIKGVITGEWENANDVFNEDRPRKPLTKEDLLHLWDEVTEQLDTHWPRLPLHRFQDEVLAFGMYEGTVYSTIFYFIDNEIHHRGQGYVYLRSLGIKPPDFWDRN